MSYTISTTCYIASRHDYSRTRILCSVLTAGVNAISFLCRTRRAKRALYSPISAHVKIIIVQCVWRMLVPDIKNWRPMIRNSKGQGYELNKSSSKSNFKRLFLPKHGKRCTKTTTYLKSVLYREWVLDEMYYFRVYYSSHVIPPNPSPCR